MNLKEAIVYINKKYQQRDILIREMDYAQNNFIEKPNPKYLFRGEKIYPTTKSFYHRLPLNDKERMALCEYIISLSSCLMEKYFGLVPESDIRYWPNINHVGDFLQHYGFPIMRLDFTVDVEIAAFFASYRNNKGKGRIWVIETKSIIENEMVFKQLKSKFTKRPVVQKAYALRMYDDKPDFQNLEHFNAVKIDFDITAEDIIHFENKNLLSTSSDPISDFIIDYIENNTVEDRSLMEILTKIKNELKDNKTEPPQFVK